MGAAVEIGVGVGEGGGVGLGVGTDVGVGGGVVGATVGVGSGAVVGVGAGGSVAGADVGDGVGVDFTFDVESLVAVGVAAGVGVFVGLGAGLGVASAATVDAGWTRRSGLAVAEGLGVTTMPPARDGRMPLQCPVALANKPNSPVSNSPANPNVNGQWRAARSRVRVANVVSATELAIAAVTARSGGAGRGCGVGVAIRRSAPPANCSRAASIAAPISDAL